MTAMQAARTLVVDDDPVMCRLLARTLQRLGHEVVVAADGVEALDRAATGVDVVLLDVTMPRLGGVETLTRLKADPATAHLPVIMVSAVDDLDAVVRCIELGATDYLSKPFEPALLVARVTSSLAAKRLRDLELDHLQQVERVIDAALALEEGRYDPALLAPVAARDDALGQLARTFEQMAGEVAAREASLRAEVDQLRIDLDGARRAERVSEIVSSGYFQHLRSQSARLKAIMSDEET